MFEAVGMILMCQVLAPVMALNFPYFGRLTVGTAKHRARGMHSTEWDVYGHGFDELELKETPAMLIIRGSAPHNRSWHLVIDTEEDAVGAADWGDLTGYVHQGSAGIGIVLIGLPALIVTSPLWLTTNLIRGAIGKLTPLDVDTWAIYLKLRGQLSREDRQHLWTALRKHCAGIESSHNARRGAEYEAKIRQEKLDRQFANWKDDYIDGPFMDRLAHGTAEPDEVMHDYEDWQRRPGVDQNVRAHEWLGMSESEFKAWYSQEKTVLQLLEERERAQVPADEAHQG